jgi:hypothetical protein
MAESPIMMILRKHPYFTQFVAVVLAGTFLSACMTWKPQPLQPERFRSADDTQTLRLTLPSGETTTVRAPVITGDSLVGLQSQPGSPDSLHRVSVPLAAISRAETNTSDIHVHVGSPDPGAAVLVVGLAAVVTVAILAAAKWFGHGTWVAP